MSSKKPTLLNILSETSRIITTHSRHFLTLSILFLFPISFLTTNYNPYLLHPTSLRSHFDPFLNPIVSKKTETPQLHTCLALFLDICAVSSITRTTINALHGHPAPKSIFHSHDQILGILGTKVVATILTGFVLIGLKIKDRYTNIYFTVYFFLTLALLAALIVFVRLQWCLMYPVTVLESTWGFAALKRSSYLVRGMRRVVLLKMMLFGIPSLVMSMWYANLMAGHTCKVNEGWVIVHMVIYSGFITILTLYSIVADAVLFVYCKELHDEPAPQIDDN